MPDDFSNEDLKTIWREQPMERSTMTLEEIGQRARDLHAKTRRELFGSTVAVLITVGFSGYGILHAHRPLLEVFAIAIAWALAGQYFLHREMWAAMIPGDAALITGLEFYRREIERRRHLFHRVLQWSFGPVVLSVGGFILMLVRFARDLNRSVSAMLPFCVLFCIWILGIFIQRSRGQRELQREIDRLNDIDEEGRR